MVRNTSAGYREASRPLGAALANARDTAPAAASAAPETAGGAVACIRIA